MALADDIARLTYIEVRRHQMDGMAGRLRLMAKLTPDAVGKVCGVSGTTVMAWEKGTAIPTTQQGLAWLTHLHESQRLAPKPGGDE